MSAHLDGALLRLFPIDLSSLDQTASLMTRRDRKYIVPLAVAADLIGDLASTTQVLTINGKHQFGYESVYFDTQDLDTYLAAARGRPRRYKVRTRSYLDSGQRMLEIKRRDGRGHTEKIRTSHMARGDVLDADGLAFIAAQPAVTAAAQSLAPVLTTTYLRATLVMAEGQRLTIDTDLRSILVDGRAVCLPEMAIIETKSTHVSTAADRLLWGLGHRPQRISKFGTSLAALEPTLPSNRWTRALRHPWSVEPAIWDAPVYLV